VTTTGQVTSPAITNVTEEFNGVAWSTGGSLINSRAFTSGAGSQTAGIVVGGSNVSTCACVEVYNIPTITTTCLLTSVGNVDQTQIKLICEPGQLFYNRDTNQLAVTINGGNGVWSNTAGLSTARTAIAATGTQNGTLAMAGGTPTETTCTELFNGYSWSTGGAMITARSFPGAMGSQNAAAVAGGCLAPATGYACTEKFNGIAWSASGALIVARFRTPGTGTQNAGLIMGGYSNSLTENACVEKFNGSTWAATGAMISSRANNAAAGTQNATVTFGGNRPGVFAGCTETFNGTAWTAMNPMLNTVREPIGAGTQNAAVSAAGIGAPGTQVSCVEEFNGISWSSSNAVTTARGDAGGAGSQSRGIMVGGYTPTVVTCTEKYNHTGITYQPIYFNLDDLQKYSTTGF
jgi:hypothetical protein